MFGAGAGRSGWFACMGWPNCSRLFAGLAAGVLLGGTLVLAAFSGLGGGSHIEAAGADAQEILRRMDAAGQARSVELTVDMTTGEGQAEKTSRMRIYSEDDASGKSKLLIRYISPPKDQGTGLLMLGDISHVWMFLPQVRKVVRMSPTMLKQSLMSGDFSFEDLLSVTWRGYADGYSPSLLKEETFDGSPAWVLDLVATKGSAAYRKVRLWIRKDSFLPARAVFFGSGGKPVKEGEYLDVKQVGGRPLPTRILFKDLQKEGRKTTLVILEAGFDADIPDDRFTVAYLEKGA